MIALALELLAGQGLKLLAEIHIVAVISVGIYDEDSGHSLFQ